MACGTGKTYTALKIAETLAEMKLASAGSISPPSPANILFLVPSISLLNQSLREWSNECTLVLLDKPVEKECRDEKVLTRGNGSIV
jgi:predicted helicase